MLWVWQGDPVTVLGRRDGTGDCKVKTGLHMGGGGMAEQVLAYVNRGDVVSDHLAMWFRAHDYDTYGVQVGEDTKGNPILEHYPYMTELPADTREACPIDGQRDCHLWTAAVGQVNDVLRLGRKAQWLGGIRVEVDADGQTTSMRFWHLITACEQKGLDWRKFTVARVAAVSPLPSWYEVFGADGPTVKMPHKSPAPPQPTVMTPKAVYRWTLEAADRGELPPLTRVPHHEVARKIREAAKVSREELAVMVGCTPRAVKAWETGERDPGQGEFTAEYIAALASLHQRQAGPVESPNGETAQSAADYLAAAGLLDNEEGQVTEVAKDELPVP